jgi:hypothetical protein
MNKEQKSRLLFDIECRLWLVAAYQKKVNRMLELGVSLNNPKLMNTYGKLERLLDQIDEKQKEIEKSTGEKVFILLKGTSCM